MHEIGTVVDSSLEIPFGVTITPKNGKYKFLVEYEAFANAVRQGSGTFENKFSLTVQGIFVRLSVGNEVFDLPRRSMMSLLDEFDVRVRDMCRQSRSHERFRQ